MAVADIILGEGAFKVNGSLIGLNRGGGSFTVEREYRVIEADGDYGPVKGRVRKIRSTPKLTLNALELSPENLKKMFPALYVDAVNGTVTSAIEIVNSDYVDVEWIGVTQDGREVVIKIFNAINMENIEFEMTDKEEIVASITYTGTYSESNRLIEPWEMIWVS